MKIKIKTPNSWYEAAAKEEVHQPRHWYLKLSLMAFTSPGPLKLFTVKTSEANSIMSSCVFDELLQKGILDLLQGANKENLGGAQSQPYTVHNKNTCQHTARQASVEIAYYVYLGTLTVRHETCF